MKHFRVYILVVAIIVVVYVGLASWLERSVIRNHEAEFNDNQALQVEFAALGLGEHFDRVNAKITMLTHYAMPLYLNGQFSGVDLQLVFYALARGFSYNELAIVYFPQPDTPDVRYVRPNDAGSAAFSLLKDWTQASWADLNSSAESIIPPFYATPDRQFYGLLVPVFYEDQFAGVLGAVFDLHPLLEEYIIPLRSGHYGAAWVSDGDGRIIYDHETQNIGQYSRELHAGFASLQRIDQELLTQEHGQGEYHFTVQRGGDVRRKLVAWTTVHLGRQRLTIAMSAPDTEINAELIDYRRQNWALGIAMVLVIIAGGGLFYFTRQRVLQKLVEQRTQELQELNEKLEQRVTTRTRELDQERAQLRAILNAMGDGLVYRQGDRIQYVNQALAELLGYPAHELVGSLSAFCHRVSVLPGACSELFDKTPPDRRARTWRGELRLLRRDGSEFTAGLSLAPVRNPSGQPVGVVSIIRDISPEKELQTQQDRFITHASHEFRTPLSNLKTRLYLLRHQPDRLDEHLTVLQQVTNHMVTLLDDLLDASRLKRDAALLHLEPVHVQAIIEAAVHAQQPTADSQQVRLAVDLPAAPLHIHADARRLRQALGNLITNAIHSTPAGREVQVRLSVYNSDVEPYIKIEIQDAGPGIPSGQLSQVFQPFFRATQGQAQSTGLGLAIAYYVIEQHGGQLTATNNQDQGSTFTIRLPLVMPEPPAPPSN